MPNNLHPHHFRHSRAMHLYQHGMELALVSQWLGHANLETTLIYAHADTEMKRRAIEKASSDICNVGTDATVPDSFDDDTLKRLYGLREIALGYADFCQREGAVCLSWQKCYTDLFVCNHCISTDAQVGRYNIKVGITTSIRKSVYYWQARH